MRYYFKKKFSRLLIASLALFAVSCNLDTFDEYGWKPNFLGPLVKAQINFYDLEDLVFLNTSYQVSGGELQGIPNFNIGVPIPVPPIEPFDLPADYIQLSEYFRTVQVNKASFTVTMDNVFPIPIGVGTRLVCVDSISNAVIFDHLITEEIPAGSVYSFPLEATNISVSKTLEFSIKDFQSPGANSVVFTNRELTVEIKIHVLDLKLMEVNKNVEYSTKGDTVSVDFGIANEADTSAYSGHISMFIESNFPTEIEVEMVLLSESNQPLLNIFKTLDQEKLIIESVEVDTDGRSLGNAVNVDLAEMISITDDIPKFQAAKKMYIKVSFKTGNSPEVFVIDGNTNLQLQLTTKLGIDPSRVNN